MAIMYPATGPKRNNSYSAEPTVYRLLEKQLNDDFHVIHSIPWLSSFVKNFAKDKSIIGEIDFLVLHQSLGVLAIEVKGGEITHNSSGFYCRRHNSKNKAQSIDPLNQLRGGTFAFQDFLRSTGIQIQIGNAFFFPESETVFADLPPGFVNYANNAPLSLVLDINDKNNVLNRVTEIMEFYSTNLVTTEFDEFTLKQIITKILPNRDYKPSWFARINNDFIEYLHLTEEQQECVQKGLSNKRLLVSGWPGTGKTLIVLQTARELSKKNQKTLVLTYNKLLSKMFERELEEYEGINISTFHSLCKKAAEKLGKELHGKHFKWLSDEAVKDLNVACDDDFLKEYETLIVDEGQVISEDGWAVLIQAFSDKRIIVMCDENQAFEFESGVSLKQLENYLSTSVFFLTQSLRMPRKVCERIKLFNEPNYSVTNPRYLEDDTLVEIITHDPEKTLKEQVDKLLSQNIPRDEIKILCSFLPPKEYHETYEYEGIQMETIARFRGMEAPVIIVETNSNITDTLLFCAYSRATSLCIVIQDAYDLKFGKENSLSTDLYSKNTEQVHSEINKVLTSELIESNWPKEQVSKGMINLYWCEKLSVYFFLSTPNNYYEHLLKSYFRKKKKCPVVYTWEEDSKDSFYCINNFEKVRVSYCETCKCKTPFLEEKLESKWQKKCIVCKVQVTKRSSEFEQDIALFNDMILNRLNYDKEERREVPAYIYCLGALHNKRINLKHKAFHIFSGEAGMIDIALVFTVLFILKCDKENDNEIRVNKVVEGTKKWCNEVNSFKEVSWKASINQAINRLITAEVLMPVKKGLKIIVRSQVSSLVLN